MQFSTGNQGQNTVAGLPGGCGTNPYQTPTTHEDQNRALLESHANQSADHYQIVARATNDAVRDWNVTTDALFWPQGLDTLFGYDASACNGTISFWQERIHPGDRTR